MKAYCGGTFSVIPVLERLRQEGLEFKPRMDYINMILPLKNKGANKGYCTPVIVKALYWVSKVNKYKGPN